MQQHVRSNYSTEYECEHGITVPVSQDNSVLDVSLEVSQSAPEQQPSRLDLHKLLITLFWIIPAKLSHSVIKLSTAGDRRSVGSWTDRHATCSLLAESVQWRELVEFICDFDTDDTRHFSPAEDN